MDGCSPLDGRVAAADVPHADEAEAAAGEAGPDPPGVAVVGVPAVEGELGEEEDEPDDRAADDRRDDRALKGLGCLVLGGPLRHGAQLTHSQGLRAEIAIWASYVHTETVYV